MKNFFSNLKGDAFGGITAGIVALPLALAFGVSCPDIINLEESSNL